MQGKRHRDHLDGNLSVDLWMTRVTLAALRLKQQIPPAPADIEAARRLSTHFQRILDRNTRGGKFLADADEKRQPRREVEEAFASLRSTPVEEGSFTLITERRLPQLLASLSEQGTLSEAKATDLLAGLHALTCADLEVDEIKVDG